MRLAVVMPGKNQSVRMFNVMVMRVMKRLTATVMLMVKEIGLNPAAAKALRPGFTDDKGVTTKMVSCNEKLLSWTVRPDRPVAAGKLIVKG